MCENDVWKTQDVHRAQIINHDAFFDSLRVKQTQLYVNIMQSFDQVMSTFRNQFFFLKHFCNDRLHTEHLMLPLQNHI